MKKKRRPCGAERERERDVASNVAGGTLKTDERENNPRKDKQRHRERGTQGERDRGRETGSRRATAGEFAAKQLQGELRSIHVACLPQADQHQLSWFRVPHQAAPVPPSPQPCNAVDSGTDVRFLMYYFGNELAVFNLMNRDGNNNNSRRRRRNLMQRQKMDSHGNSPALYAYLSVCVVCVCVLMFC